MDDAGEDEGEGDEEGAEAGADSVVGGDEFIALGDLHEEDEVAGETDAVAEGFEEDDGVEPVFVGEGVGGPDVEEVGEVHADDEGPEGASETDTGDEPAAEETTEEEAEDLADAFDDAELFEGKTHAAFGFGVEEEDGDEEGDHGFAEAVEDDEGEDGGEAWLSEVGGEGLGHGGAADEDADEDCKEGGENQASADAPVLSGELAVVEEPVFGDRAGGGV